jgi:hypothetical protein
LNCPGSAVLVSMVPKLPVVHTSVPSASNFWMRWLRESATNTEPSGPTAIERGELNWPGATPSPPHTRSATRVWRPSA